MGKNPTIQYEFDTKTDNNFNVEKFKIQVKKRTNIVQIYKDMGLKITSKKSIGKRDIKSARKYLNDIHLATPKTASREEINAMLRDIYRSINPTVYLYDLQGYSQKIYHSKENGWKLLEKEYFNMQFQSQDRVKLKHAFSYRRGEDGPDFKDEVAVKPIIYDEGEALDFLNNRKAVDQIANFIGFVGIGYSCINTIQSLTRLRLRQLDTGLADMPMYHASVNLPYEEFKGFTDKGEMTDKGDGDCVLDTVYHHLKLGANRGTKKITREMVHDILRGDNKKEQGYTAKDVCKTLDYFKCRGRMLDINKKQFLATKNMEKRDTSRNLPVFVAICYNNHLYYCTDKKCVKSFSVSIANQMRKNNNQFDFQTFVKKERRNGKTFEYYSCHKDLLHKYQELYTKDRVIRKVKTKDGNVVSIEDDDTMHIYHPKHNEVEKSMGDNFDNQNFTTLGAQIFKGFCANFPESNFSKMTFDAMTKLGNIVKTYHNPEVKINGNDRFLIRLDEDKRIMSYTDNEKGKVYTATDPMFEKILDDFQLRKEL